MSQKYIWSQTITFWSVGLFFRMCFFSLVWRVHTHCRCRGFLLHLTRTQSVGLLLTRDRPVSDRCTWQYITLTRDRKPCPRQITNLRSDQGSGHTRTRYTTRALRRSALRMSTKIYWVILKQVLYQTNTNQKLLRLLHFSGNLHIKYCGKLHPHVLALGYESTNIHKKVISYSSCKKIITSLYIQGYS
jgi:hypothetical protein